MRSCARCRPANASAARCRAALTRAGLTVVGLERDRHQATVPDFQGPAMHDELRYAVRKGMMQDNTRETLTFRNNASQTALPVRRYQAQRTFGAGQCARPALRGCFRNE
ncbi:hypothetical protein [Pseudorhodoferax aquiterrae]|uniref:hypothetical protein n=1 Tax=Pseudorhodoferax aquiterrae TaxID=747304 RepID=UPI001673647F|nr:hypothetical protein [Pseudorhodoferax aquiterrae]